MPRSYLSIPLSTNDIVGGLFTYESNFILELLQIESLQEQFGKKSKISRSIEKGTLDSITTKDKRKAALIAIQYSAPDRAILFSFYNHPQPL